MLHIFKNKKCGLFDCNQKGLCKKDDNTGKYHHIVDLHLTSVKIIQFVRIGKEKISSPKEVTMNAITQNT